MKRNKAVGYKLNEDWDQFKPAFEAAVDRLGLSEEEKQLLLDIAWDAVTEAPTDPRGLEDLARDLLQQYRDDQEDARAQREFEALQSDFEPVAVGDIAKRAGVKPDTIYRWIERHPDFPKQFCETSAGRLWFWSDVKTWLRKTGRLE